MPQEVYQISSTQYGNLIVVTTQAAPPDDEFVLSDHNREPLSVVTERIEVTRRTAKGNRRRYLIADKVSFTVSWRDLPGLSTQTVDGGRGAEELESLFALAEAEGEVTVQLKNADNSTTNHAMHITGFDKSISKRYQAGYYYDVSITFEEV